MTTVRNSNNNWDRMVARKMARSADSATFICQQSRSQSPAVTPQTARLTGHALLRRRYAGRQQHRFDVSISVNDNSHAPVVHLLE